MVKQRVNKFRIVALASLFTLAMASAPAKAHHGADYVAPLAALVVFGALVHHGHHHRHEHYRYRHYSYHRPQRHSHSRGGYHNQKRKHYQRW